MSRLLRLLHTSLQVDGIGSSITFNNSPILFPMASFHDDLMIPVSAPSKLIVSHNAKAISTAAYVFSSFGLSLNFSTNNSEAIISFAGPGSYGARVELAKNGDCCQFSTVNNPCNTLRFVKSYKHLGTKTSVSCNMAEEVVLRSCVMAEDEKKLRKKVF